MARKALVALVSGGLVVLLLAAVASMEVSDSRAAAAAQAFCASIAPGGSADSLEQDARAAGARLPRAGWIKLDIETDALMARFSGLDALDGHLCVVRAVNGIVVDREVVRLDL
ncbi:MAG: hypothetical protein MEQ07_03540 [Aquimonas sp.]|nr:hypothetical protein [Aquimonas sp.]